VQNEVTIKAKPRAVLAIAMVFLWLKREDTKPDPIRVRKYPREIIKNNVPASAWVRFRSFSIRGIRGAGVIRETKLKKKIDVRISSGPSWPKKEFPVFLSPAGVSKGFEDLSIFQVNLLNNMP
jgi:hypothetical protein